MALEQLLRIRSHIQSAEFKERDSVRWETELRRFWDLCEETDSAKEALAACADLSTQFRDNADYIEKAFEWLTKAKYLREAFSELTTTRDVDERSLLSTLFHSRHGSYPSFHRNFHRALQGHPELVQKGYTDSFIGLKDQQMLLGLRHWYGVSLFHHDRRNDAVKEWESVSSELEGLWNDKDIESIVPLFTLNAEQLATAYITMAYDKRPSEEEASLRLGNIEKCKQRMDQRPEYGDNYLVLMLGRLYHVTGHFQKARTSIRKYMRTASALLENDQDDDDWRGHFMLMEALLCLDDEENARAAWSLIATAHSEELVCELSITCAGGCDWTWDGISDIDRDIYICKDCAHVQLEVDCFKKLRAGSWEERVCSSKHKLTKFPKMRPRDRRRVQSGHVLIRKMELKIGDWLDKIRETYSIRKRDQSWPARQAESIRMARWTIRRGVVETLKVNGKRARMLRRSSLCLPRL